MALIKNKYGQYMTPKIVAEFMLSLSTSNNLSRVLEPCCGDGVFLDTLINLGYNDVTAYEIDNTLIASQHAVVNKSFVSSFITNKFNLIIGNPPYIRWKNLETDLKNELPHNVLWMQYCNSLCDYSSIFILKSIELLETNGELIFITPEYWINTTHAKLLRNYMLDNGYLTHIYHFNETPIFDNASVSTIIFKFIKSKSKPQPFINVCKYYKKQKLTSDILNNLSHFNTQDGAVYFSIPQFKKNSNWVLASIDMSDQLNFFASRCKKINSNEFHLMKEYCDIGNGMVSGLDEAFQINNLTLTKQEKNNILQVVKAKNINQFYYKNITNYIFINQKIETENEFKHNFPNFYNHLLPYKDKLNQRYNYNKNINYWEWVFLRNYKLFNKKIERIFVPCKERITNKNNFRFAFSMENIYPTQDVTAIIKKESTVESIYYILAFLNSRYVFDWLRYNGTIKGDIVEFCEKPIANTPFRKIDFNNESERKLHHEISELTKEYILNKNHLTLINLNTKVDELFI